MVVCYGKRSVCDCSVSEGWEVESRGETNEWRSLFLMGTVSLGPVNLRGETESERT